MIHLLKGKTFFISKLKIPKDPSLNEKSILITSALPYVNNVPHLGNVIGSVLSADVFARYNRSLDNNTLFICGTDQYGTATEVKAMKQNKTPKQICDKYHEIHKNIYKWFDISFNHFGRTSSPIHKQIVSDIFLDLDKNGFISEKQTSQHYCNKCSMFLADRYIKGTCPNCGSQQAKGDQCETCNKLITTTQLKNPQCLVCHSSPQIKQTKHLYLKTGQLKSDLSNWLDQSLESGRWSHNAKAITNDWLDNLISERSISRDLKWGVPVPKKGYQDKVFYVWFDAPIGYISITAELLPESYRKWWDNSLNIQLYQFMGKDNVPFHSIIFPASLMGSRKPWKLVNSISATEYLQYEGAKFSKSASTGIFCDVISSLDIDSSIWRYYLIYNRPQRFDRNFEWNDFFTVVNRDLINNIGNLFQRVITFCSVKLSKQKLITDENLFMEEDKQFLSQAQQLFNGYIVSMNKIQLKQGLNKVIQISTLANKYLQKMQPWTKINLSSGRSKTIITILLNYLVLITSMIEPFAPQVSIRGCKYLGLITPIHLSYFTNNFKQNILRCFPERSNIQKPQQPFLNILKLERIDQYKNLFGPKQQ